MYSPLEQFKISSFFMDSLNGYFLVSFLILFLIYVSFEILCFGYILFSRYYCLVILSGVLLKTNILKLVEHSSLMTTLSLFTMFLVFNLSAIFPWVPSIMSHFSWTLGISISMSITALMVSLLRSREEMVVSVLPRGVPYWLHLPLTLIEVSGLLARSMALGIRMSANMISGHVLLHLLSNSMFSVISSSYFFLTPLVFGMLIVFYLVEIGVAMVQSYVFTLIMARIVYMFLEMGPPNLLS